MNFHFWNGITLPYLSEIPFLEWNNITMLLVYYYSRHQGDHAEQGFPCRSSRYTCVQWFGEFDLAKCSSDCRTQGIDVMKSVP